MTRKDYVIIAAALKKSGDECRAEYANGAYATERIAREIARALAADNPRFDGERFLKAAGVL